MTAHSADRFSSRVAGIAAPALAAAVAASPGRPAARNSDDLTTTTARNSPAAATDRDRAPSVRGAYIYGYDSAGNPTLTDVGNYGSSYGKLPD